MGSGIEDLHSGEKQSNGVVTITLNLHGPSTSAEAITCSKEGATGGVWGAEFWASSAPGASDGPPNGNFYVAYRDNPPDGTPEVEVGRASAVSRSLNHYEFSRQ